MEIRRLTPSEWGDALPDSGFEVFHTPEALEVLDEHATGELRLYGGFKGQQPVGLLPAFVQKRSVGRAVTSPPPGMGVPRLGPVVMPTSPKRRKREKVNRNFTEEVLRELQVGGSMSLFRVICTTDYADPRPYVWSDLELDTNFTYYLDVSDGDADALKKSFSKSLRREIRDAEDLDVSVEREGVDGARAVYEDTVDRYAEQGKQFSLSWPYVRDLVDSLAATDRARVYVARDSDGEFLSGITVLYSNDQAYFWQGGARAVYEGTSVNSLVHWRITQDLVSDPPLDSVHRYDLMGANTERLCRYKAKFGADLVPYYVVESGGKSMDVAKKAYNLVSR